MNNFNSEPKSYIKIDAKATNEGQTFSAIQTSPKQYVILKLTIRMVPHL